MHAAGRRRLCRQELREKALGLGPEARVRRRVLGRVEPIEEKEEGRASRRSRGPRGAREENEEENEGEEAGRYRGRYRKIRGPLPPHLLDLDL